MSFLISIFFTLTLMSCQEEEKVTLDRDDFTISYPKYLELDESGKEGTTFILTTQKDGQSDVFVENVNLATKSANGVKFEKYAEETTNQINSVASISEKKIFEQNGKKCLRVIFELVQNNIELTFVQHYFISNNKVYALTFSSETKAYDDYYDEMNSVLMSFKIK